jgi:hypothetical protein
LTTLRAYLDSRQNLNMPWGMTMPFSRYKIADSSLMEAMRAAFHKVCEELQLNCDREDPLTEVVITKIVELAKAGECCPEILCRKVLAELERPMQTEPSRAPHLRIASAGQATEQG